MAEGIIAHEMGHLAGRHQLKMRVMWYMSIFVIVVSVVMIGEASWAVWAAVALTVFPVSLPLLSRHLEYDADRRGALVVGSETMSLALRAFIDRPQWDRESDTHPSIERRLVRLRKGRS